MTDETRDPAASLGSHARDQLQLLMVAIGFKVACVACYYGAAPLGGLAIGMVAGFLIPLVAIAVLEPWLGPFHCGECNDD